MDQSSAQPRPRPTGIPRLSRLPLPRSTRPAAPTASEAPAPPQPRKPLASSTHAKTLQEDRFKMPGRPSTRTIKPSRPSPTVQKPKKYIPPEESGNTPSPSTSPSQAANDQVDDAPQGGSQLKSVPKTPGRPSLAERTVESIAKIPPSPAVRRRRSSFFSPESPMGSRPQSSTANRSRSNSNDDTPRMPPIPKGRPLSKPQGTKAITSTSRLIGRGSSGSKGPATSKTQTPKASTPKSATLPRRPATSKPSTSKLPNNSKTISARPGRPKVPSSVLKKSALSSPKGSEQPTASADQSPSSKSSAALREQIRKAKAARKSSGAKHSLQGAEELAPEMPGFDVGTHDDPFNQLPKGGASVLRRRADSARTDGRLNIAALALKEIPEEVLKMYDYDYNKDSSGVAWGEAVDLTKFIAADNELEAIPDEVFPDTSPSALDDDDIPVLFGGLELLDLHGNHLTALPLGVRRLERLTVLNLSRNKLANDAIDLIAQITSLKDLKLSDNALAEELNPAIANLVHLEVLEVQGNKISSLPTQIKQMIRLRVLNVSNNCLSSLPMTELSELPLTQLHASKNYLSGTLFPQPEVKMTRLQHLDISINSIEALSASRLSLPLLRELNMAFNRIPRLPDLTDWTSLVSLLAEDNRLSDIPRGFAELATLRTVDFTGNDFARLDPRIGVMVALETFKLAANPIRERKFLTMGTAEVKRDLRARMGNDEPGNEVD